MRLNSPMSDASETPLAGYTPLAHIGGLGRHPDAMKKKEFNQLLESVHELGAALRGDKKVITRTDRIDPDLVAVIRGRLKLSQGEFARMLGISVDTLQNWEQGRRKPSGAARVLLKIAACHPEAVREAVA